MNPYERLNGPYGQLRWYGMGNASPMVEFEAMSTTLFWIGGGIFLLLLFKGFSK